MTECDLLRDAMPEVQHGRRSWTTREQEHLDACAECLLEWRIVDAGAALGETATVDSAGIAARLLTELESAPVVALPAIRRIPWRGPAIIALAAAASVALVLTVRHPVAGPVAPQIVAVVDSAAPQYLPELQRLSDDQLADVLHDVGPVVSDATPGLVPHLEDLTDSELEQLLQSEGGE